MNVAIIGAGYVGLTTGACLASMGHDVCCVDIDDRRIAELNAGHVPIYEPGLAALLAEMVSSENIRFSSDVSVSVRHAEVVFMAVGTPARTDGDIDLSFIHAAARDIAPALRKDAIVVVKSTVVPGTADAIADILQAERSGSAIAVASNPEFLREGSAISDFINADRIVIGTDDPLTAERMKELYRPLIARGVPLVSTTRVEAELIKYAANAFLALKIGFINDIANICEIAGGDVADVARGIGLDQRIGRHFLKPGPGFGGSCFPKDTRALAAIGRRFGCPQPLIETLILRNDARKTMLADRILAILRAEGQPQRVTILGTAFKAETDDIRDSPAIAVIRMLIEAGITVVCHDPKARDQTRALFGDRIEWHDDPYDAARGAQGVAILTEWQSYRDLDLKRLASAMTGRHLFDFRNLLSPQSATAKGFYYHGLGRPLSLPDRRLARPDAKGKGVLRTNIAASPA